MSHSIRPFLSSALASLPLLMALPTSAQENTGLYVNAYGGSSSLGSTQISESRPALPLLSGKAKFGSGTSLGGAVGYRYGNGWAAELAWDYRGHKIKRIGNTAVTGDFASTVLFVNGYYRFQKVGIVRPFVGLGLGYVTEMDIDISRGAASPELEYSKRGGFATQAILGGEFDLSKHWSLSADVRLSQMGSGTFKATTAGNSLNGKPKYQPTSLNLGVTYKF